MSVRNLRRGMRNGTGFFQINKDTSVMVVYRSKLVAMETQKRLTTLDMTTVVERITTKIGTFDKNQVTPRIISVDGKLKRGWSFVRFQRPFFETLIEGENCIIFEEDKQQCITGKCNPLGPLGSGANEPTWECLGLFVRNADIWWVPS